MALNDYIIADGQQLYLGDNVIRITKQLSDIAQTDNRQTLFTNRMSLPWTEQNLNALGLPNSVNNSDDPQYELVRAAVFAAGIPIESQGNLRIMEVNENIDCVVNGPEQKYFADRDKVSLHDLANISDLDHVWSLAEIAASQAYTEADGYKYPVINYGGFSTTANQLDGRYQYPAVYIKWLLDQIALDSGFTFVCPEIFDEAWYPKLMLPFSEGGYEHSQRYKEERSFEYFTSQAQTYPAVFTSNITDQSIGNVVFGSAVVYSAPVAVTMPNVSAKVNVTRIATDGNTANTTTAKLAIVKNGTTVLTSTPLTLGINTLTTASVALVATDTLSVQILATSTVGASPATLNVDIDSGSFYTDPITDAIAFGDDITGESFVPDWTQKEFLVAFMNQFGLIPKVDIFEKTVTFFPFDNIYENIGKAIDWSDKLSKPANTNAGQWYKSKSGVVKGYGVVNYLKYAEDETLRDPNFGRGVITSNNNTLTPEKELFTLPWAASESDLQFSTSTFVVRIHRWVGDYDAETLEEFTDAKQRFVLVEDETLTLTVTDGTTTTGMGSTASIAKFLDPSLDFSPAFSGSVQAKFYSALAAVLTDPLFLIAQFNLSAADVAGLDLFIPVYVDKFSAYFYVNKVKDFEAGTLTDVELIRL